MKRCLQCDTTFESPSWDCPSCGFSPAVIDGYRAFAPDLAQENDGMAPHSHALLDRLQEGNFWFRARNNLIMDLVKAHFPGAQRVLEVGCGTGFVLKAVRRALPQAAIVGSEIYANGLGHAAKRLGERGEVLQMDARHIPYEKEFDLVCAFDVLEHIEEDEDALREIIRATKPGGGVLLSVPQHPSLWSAADDYAHHKRRYRIGELKEKCLKAGLHVERDTSFVSSLLPLMALQRYRRRSVKSFDPSEELRLAGPLNQALEAVLNAERLLISAGVSLPFGGSRFVVARKL